MGQEYTAEIGRALGWDLAYYGWSPREDAPIDVIEGHTAGKARFGDRPKHPTRFERKWLQLRQNALRRGRVVDSNVTPELIEAIDHPVCPVTLVTMTHSTGTNSDWSVDRVNNDGGYADGNLVVMSVRANKAKGEKTYGDVTQIITENRPDAGGLSWQEWRRLRGVMYGPCHPNEATPAKVPLISRLPNRIVRNSYQQLQHAVLLMARADSSNRKDAIRELATTLPDPTVNKLLLTTVVERVMELRKTAEYEYDVFDDAKVQDLLGRWDDRIPLQLRPLYRRTLANVVGGDRLSSRMVDTWSIPTGGRYPT